MKIYRVAHLGLINKQGIPTGPYNVGSALGMRALIPFAPHIEQDLEDLSCELWDALITMETYTPPPYAENLNFREGVHYSAFPSRDKVYEWFTLDVLETLMDEGFDLLVYDIPDDQVQHARKQSAARLENAILVSVESLF